MSTDLWQRPLLVLALAGLAGCDSPKPTPPAQPSTASEVAPRETIRKTTQDVLRLADALAQGGQIAEAGGTVGPSGGYLGTLAKTYRQAAGLGGTYAANQAIQAHEILNGPLKNYEEFQSVIVRKGDPTGLVLPMLPYYQEYAYDEANHTVVIVEFPKRREEVERSR
ncbi:MAG: hypothetical protein KatS3mg108_0180 [Isosphaeraceae bacterium]|jgi:hypothetical protein|nr:MAG: hypothetical protein KatS3mg108_0180 [Isosphaeraceae bacterium]